VNKKVECACGACGSADILARGEKPGAERHNRRVWFSECEGCSRIVEGRTRADALARMARKPDTEEPDA
jgi:hypothetical protein